MIIIIVALYVQKTLFTFFAEVQGSSVGIWQSVTERGLMRTVPAGPVWKKSCDFNEIFRLVLITMPMILLLWEK